MSVNGVQSSRHRLRSGFAFLLGAAGLALCGWYGSALLSAPQYSQADIARSAQLNLAVDLARLPPNLRPAATEHAEMLDNERQEVVDDISLQHKKRQAGFGAGVILLVLAAGRLLLNRYGSEPDQNAAQ